MCHTINIFNVMYIPEFLAWAEQFGISVYLNSLHYPDYYNIRCLPYDAKRLISRKLQDHPNPNVKTFIDYMNQEGKDHFDEWMKFVNWTLRKDEFRKEKFDNTFPELAEATEYNKYISKKRK